MSKELKALEALKRIRQETIPATYNQDFDKEECCEIIETALNEKINIENRLDEIFENHNIKSFTELNERLCDYNELKFDDDIKQNKLKTLEIIKEKNVNIRGIKETKNVHEYNIKFPVALNEFLEEQEYDLLKEVLKGDN